MEMSLPESQEQAAAWELSKENVKPVKSGRNVRCIKAVLQPSEEDIERLMKEKQRFEEDLITAEHSEDPIEPWHRYLEWTIQNFPTGKNIKTLSELLSKLIKKFKGAQYNNDERYVNAWLKLAEIVNDPLEIYSYMNTEGLGKYCAKFYIAWAEEYEKYGDTKKANRIYTDGLANNAIPSDLLQKHHVEFQLRIANGFLKSACQESDENERVTFNQLEGRGKHSSVGSVRVGTAFKPLGNQEHAKKSHAMLSEPFEIHRDETDKVTVMGEAGKWTSIPSKSASKENTMEPGQWNNGFEHKRKSPRHSMPRENSQIEFDIYEDDNKQPNFSEAPSQCRTITKSVLSDKKESSSDFSQIHSVLHEKPVHDERSKSFYDADKVYTVMGEMQFEEVRAAFWRKKQRLIAQQEHDLEQERLQERKAQLMQREREKMKEERLFVEEKMKIMEIERKVMETERIKMTQCKLDLLNRLKEIKVMEKTAMSWQEAENLHKEEEDITVRLGVVERKLRRSGKFEDMNKGAASSSSTFCQHAIADTGVSGSNNQSTVVIQKKGNDQENEEVQALTSLMQKETFSGNNSLNHSRRSQPSPTVNTKEAMTHVIAWFQKPLDDDFEDNSVYQDENSNVVNQSQRLTERKTGSVNENTAPFDIFVEDTDRNPTLPKQGDMKVGLTHRNCHSMDLGCDVAANEESKALNPYSDDKTEAAFDDVTVAGSHFTAKARMASTPAISKSNLLQDSRHISNLSCIPPYNDMQKSSVSTLEIYEDRNGGDEISEDKHVGKEMYTEKQAEIGIYEDGPIGDSTDEYFRHVKENYMPVDEVKQLTPIMEDSNEYEKSSLAKSCSNQSEAATSRDLVESALAKTKMDCNPAAFPLKTVVEDQSMHSEGYESNDSFDFSFWGEKIIAEDSHNKETPVHRKGEDDVIAEQDKLETVNDVSQRTNITKHALNIVQDPWDDGVLADILQRNDSIFKGSNIPVVYQERVLPMSSVKSGACLKLDETLKLGKLVGAGAFAKVYEVINKELVVKVQSPPCTWELYAVTVAKTRLLSQGMHDIAEAIVPIHSGFIYNDCSLLLLPRFRRGTLLDAINAKRGNVILKDAVTMWIACEIMTLIHGLHKVGIIHGDIKPDNFMIGSGLDGELNTTIKLIDFGRAIDMTEMPEHVMFTKDCGTSGFSCIQMRSGQPWNYHTDYYGIAGTLYVVLFGAYMNVQQSDDGSWKITGKLKRWHDALWNEFFNVLLNHPTPSVDNTVAIAESPLPNLLERFKEKINSFENLFPMVNRFFKGL